MVMIMPAFAGCDVKDWYNQSGTVRIQLEPQPAQGSHLDSFKSVKAAIYGVSLKQAGESLNVKHFTFGKDPKIVDLVDAGKKGTVIELTEFKTSLRATERIAVQIAVFEAIDAAGASMEICRLADTPQRFPCFYVPDDDLLLFEGCPSTDATCREKSFAPPRGGMVVVHFPVAIQYAQDGPRGEYFLFADPAKVGLENRR